MDETIFDKIQEAGQARQTRLLIVDDEEPLLKLLSDFFSQRGYHLFTAATLTEAEIHLREEIFDLILLDLLLPDGDGAEFLPVIKELQPRVPVIVMTGLGYDEEFLQAARANGASGYVSKFLPLDQLLMEVHRVTGQRSANR